MFGKAKVQEGEKVELKSVQEAVVYAPESTVEVVRRELFAIPPTERSHRARIDSVTKRGDFFSGDSMKKLEELNLVLFVNPSIVTMFEYAAGVFPKRAGEDNLVTRGGNGIVFAGDIPEFALDRIQELEKTDFRFTIHSHFPFPVRYEKCDPVIIAWNKHPEIYSDSSGKFCTSASSLVGVIVAVWDNDKELEL